MGKIKKAFFVTLFLILLELVLCLSLYPLITKALSSYNALIITLILDFLIIRLAYANVLDKHKLTVLVSGVLCFVLVMAFLSGFYFLNPSEHSGRYLLNELFLKLLFSEPLAVIALFNAAYSAYKLLLSCGLKKRTAAIVFEILMVLVFILSAAVYDQYIEKESRARNGIWSFVSLVNETVYKLNSGKYYDIDRETNLLAASFRYNIYNVYDIGYPDNLLVFELLEDYTESHQSKDDISKVSAYLEEFENSLRRFMGENAVITDRKISEFIMDKTDEFKNTVLE